MVQVQYRDQDWDQDSNAKVDRPWEGVSGHLQRISVSLIYLKSKSIVLAGLQPQKSILTKKKFGFASYVHFIFSSYFCLGDLRVYTYQYFFIYIYIYINISSYMSPNICHFGFFGNFGKFRKCIL